MLVQRLRKVTSAPRVSSWLERRTAAAGSPGREGGKEGRNPKGADGPTLSPAELGKVCSSEIEIVLDKSPAPLPKRLSEGR